MVAVQADELLLDVRLEGCFVSRGSHGLCSFMLPPFQAISSSYICAIAAGPSHHSLVSSS